MKKLGLTMILCIVIIFVMSVVYAASPAFTITVSSSSVVEFDSKCWNTKTYSSGDRSKFSIKITSFNLKSGTPNFPIYAYAGGYANNDPSNGLSICGYAEITSSDFNSRVLGTYYDAYNVAGIHYCPGLRAAAGSNYVCTFNGIWNADRASI